MLLVVEEYHMRKILILLVLALLVGCSSEQVATTQPVQASAGSQTVEAEPVMHALTLSLYDEEPDQREFTVKQGDLVTLEVINTDADSKIFVIEGLNIAEKVSANGMAVFEFEAKKKGHFPMGVQDSIIKAQLSVE